MPHHAQLNGYLSDLRDRALDRARVLSGHTETKPAHPRECLRELQDEIDRLTIAILNIADDQNLGHEEQTIIYALVSLLTLMSETPFNARIEHLVNDRFLAARYQINALRRARRKSQSRQKPGSPKNSVRSR